MGNSLLHTSQDAGLALGPGQYYHVTSNAEDSFQEYHTPPEQTGTTYPFVPTDGPDANMMRSMNNDQFLGFFASSETLDLLDLLEIQ